MHGLYKPTSIGWQQTFDGGWVCEVWQSAYGHLANKSTWLYYYGNKAPFPLKWDRPQGLYQIGGKRKQKDGKKWKEKPTLSGKEASATPLEFRDALISLAINSV